jgi:hypothetical protein
MLGPKILPVIFVALPAAMVFTAQSSLGEPTGEACRTGPGASAPQGMHWYYHIDRTDKRDCWYLSSEGRPLHARHNVAVASSSQHERAAIKVAATPKDAAFAPLQPAVARTSDVESSVPALSARVQPAIDFADRWVELPKALDSDVRNSASLSNGYADEHESNGQGQMSLPPFISQGNANESWQSSTGALDFRSTLLAVVLGMALLLMCRETLKLGGMLHREAKRRRANADFMKAKDSARSGAAWRERAVQRVPRSSHAADHTKMGLGALMRVLRQASAGPYALRSFAPSGDRMTKTPAARRLSPNAYSGRRTRSAYKASRRIRATV